MVARSSRTADDATQSSLMTLALRRTVWLDGENRPNDYTVFHDGQKVGRIYRINSTARELWLWTQRDIRAPTYGPNGGVADTLETWDGYGAFENTHGRSPRSNQE